MALKNRNNRQIKKLAKKKVFYYKSDKIYRVVPTHSTEIHWWDALEGDNVKQFMSIDNAEDELAKHPVGSYVIFYDYDKEHKEPTWQYIMKTRCSNCKNKCGNRTFKMKRKFGKNFTIKFKQPTQCELKNQFKGLTHWGKV
jgi:hypothetical protein